MVTDRTDTDRITATDADTKAKAEAEAEAETATASGHDRAPAPAATVVPLLESSVTLDMRTTPSAIWAALTGDEGDFLFNLLGKPEKIEFERNGAADAPAAGDQCDVRFRNGGRFKGVISEAVSQRFLAVDAEMIEAGGMMAAAFKLDEAMAEPDAGVQMPVVPALPLRCEIVESGSSTTSVTVRANWPDPGVPYIDDPKFLYLLMRWLGVREHRKRVMRYLLQLQKAAESGRPMH
ncbi:MAG: hypothetical protein ACOC0P_04070 [Planctomycetota bacterium]